MPHALKDQISRAREHMTPIAGELDRRGQQRWGNLNGRGKLYHSHAWLEGRVRQDERGPSPMVPNFDHHDPAGLQDVNGVAARREMMTPYARGFTCGTVTVRPARQDTGVIPDCHSYGPTPGLGGWATVAERIAENHDITADPIPARGNCRQSTTFRCLLFLILIASVVAILAMKNQSEHRLF
jgi:hypothetical protein